jgi:hypothetical protein
MRLFLLDKNVLNHRILIQGLGDSRIEGLGFRNS